MHLRYTVQKSLSLSQKKQLLRLWNNEYPLVINYDSINGLEQYLQNIADLNHILIQDANNSIQGWYYDFIRENERWFAIIINSAIQGKGYGTSLLRMAQEKRNVLNGWVIPGNGYVKKNGSIYESPIEFYKKMDFKIIHDIKRDTEKLDVIKITWTER